MLVQEDDVAYYYVGYSILNTFKTCKELARLSYKDHLEPRKENLAFTFGSAFHAALEKHTTGAPLDDAVRAFVSYLREHDSLMKFDIDDHEKRTIERGIALVEGYYEKWKHETFRVYRTPDGKPYSEIPFKLSMGEWDGIPIVLGGTLDSILENTINGSLYIKETKTTSTALSMFMQKTKPNYQLSIYSYACSELLKLHTSGIIWDCIFVSNRKPNPSSLNRYERLGVSLEDFGRTTTMRNETDHEQLIEDLNEDIRDYLTWYTSGKERWPRTTSHCHDYGNCSMIDVCISNANKTVIETTLRPSSYRPWKDVSSEKHVRSVERRFWNAK